MKTKIYLDNSVFGGFFDAPFKKDTRILFEQIEAEKFEVYISDTLREELIRAPIKVQQVLDKVPKNCLVEIASSDESRYLANEYIKRGVIGKSHFNDTMHIATATYAGMSALVSWNLKHIVNHLIPRYNQVNRELGYNEIQIISPPQIIY